MQEEAMAEEVMRLPPAVCLVWSNGGGWVWSEKVWLWPRGSLAMGAA